MTIILQSIRILLDTEGVIVLITNKYPRFCGGLLHNPTKVRTELPTPRYTTRTTHQDREKRDAQKPSKKRGCDTIHSTVEQHTQTPLPRFRTARRTPKTPGRADVRGWTDGSGGEEYIVVNNVKLSLR